MFNTSMQYEVGSKQKANQQQRKTPEDRIQNIEQKNVNRRK